MKNNVNNKIFIITGPSGAGEDSVIEGLKKFFPIDKAVTTSTREKRDYETEGHPYYFISKEEFQSGLEKDRFFEWAEQDRGNYYGVTKEEIERLRGSDDIKIWKLDYKGVINAKKLSNDIIAIFLDVPMDVIEKRIRNRTNVTEEFVQKRLEYAKGWLEIRDMYDYEVKNVERKLEETIKKVADIIIKEANIDKF